MMVIYMRMLLLTIVIFLNCSMAAAYTPMLAIDITDDNQIYNSEIVRHLKDSLSEKLTAEGKFQVVSENADYLIEGQLIGMGTCQLVSNPMGTAYTISGSASSLFISPFAGPVIGGIGLMQTRKNVFAVAIKINVIRTSDEKIVKRRAFLGRTNLKKGKLSPEVLESTINHTTELIAKYFIKDVEREKPKIFVQSPQRD